MMRKALVVGGALVLMACAGARARDNALAPLMGLWSQVKQDAQAYGGSLEGEARSEVLERVRLADQVMHASDRLGMRAQPWGLIEQDAAAGIPVMVELGQIEANGVELAAENHRVFFELLRRFLWRAE